MLSPVQVTVVFPPSLDSSAAQERLLRHAARAAVTDRVAVLACSGQLTVQDIADAAAAGLADADPALVLLPTGTEGEEIAALVAAKLQGTSLGRCARVELADGAVRAVRTAFGGRAELVVRSTARVTCATLRPDATADDVALPALVRRDIAGTESAQEEVESVASPGTHPRVEGARIVVSGGRGIGSEEGFELLARIAAALGAGLGGSLPAVDAGWVPVAHQVGQSGKFVSPELYLAVGISGTPQHLAGIAGETRVVAINTDPEAPIFERASAGVVGDWREILPLLAQQLEAVSPA